MITRNGYSVRARLTLIAVTVTVLCGILVTTVLTLALYDMAEFSRTNEVAGSALEVVNLARSGARGPPPCRWGTPRASRS